MGCQPFMDLKLYRQPLMILYIEANHDGFATYQNKENNAQKKPMQRTTVKRMAPKETTEQKQAKRKLEEVRKFLRNCK